jgi:peptidoglycan/LPS O-acetylase OafA/YrhL
MKTEAQGAAAIHSDRRLPALTGMRIFAAVAVYLSHLPTPAGASKPVATFLGSGYCGVTIFFVLSGFVLAYNYFDSLKAPSPGKIWEYLVARFARVYPLYLLFLLFIMVEMHAAGISVSGWWSHALAIQAWDPNGERTFSFNQPAWSVSVEFFLYACLPLLIPVVAKLRSVRSMLLTAAAVVTVIAGLAAWFVLTGKGDLPYTDPSSAHRWLYRTPLTRIGDFMLGILAARLFLTIGHQRAAVTLGRVLTPLSILAIVALMAWPGLYYTAWSWDLAYAVPAVLLIFGLAVAPRTIPARFLALPAIVLLGEASYAFYLIHFNAIGWFGAGLWSVSFSISRLVTEAMVLGMILALSIGLHVSVEMPARKFLRGLLSLRPGSPLANLLARRKRTPAEAPSS